MVGESSADASTLYVSEKVGILTETPNVELTVNGKISSNSIIYDEIGNSTQWNSVYTNINQNSATYAEINFVQNNFLPLSGGIISGKTQFNSDVTIWGILSATGGTYFANTIYSTTSALSVIHVGSGPALYVGSTGTGDIASFYDLDQNIEILHIGGHDGDYPNVGIKTSTPNKDFSVNGEISASNTIWSKNSNSDEWASAYSTVQQNSANKWNTSEFLPLSGGTLSGKLNLLPSTFSSVPINLGSGAIPSNTVAGDLFSSGNNIWFKGTSGGPYIFAYKNDTNIFYLPQIISTVSPTGDNAPALRITQTGGGEALRIEDETNPDSTPFIVNSIGSVGIGLSSLSNLDAKLTVVGNISANGIVYDNNGNSNLWNSVYSSVNPVSSNWDSVYTTYNKNSAFYSTTQFVDNKFLPLSGGTINGNLSVVGSISATQEIYVNDQKTVKTAIAETASLSSVNSIVVVSTLPATQIYGTLYILV
jgi:hypothetical protein